MKPPATAHPTPHSGPLVFRRWAGLLAVVLLATATGCGNTDAPNSPRDRWIGDGEDPMAIPETYQRTDSPNPDEGDDSGPISLYDPNRPGEQKRMVLQPNVYALKPSVADRATIEPNEVSLPLDNHAYLARRKAGDIVISPNTDFAWRRIDDVEFDGSTVHWKTERPDIRSVIKEGYFYLDAQITDPEGIPPVDLASPYASGPLEMFRRGPDGEFRQRRQAAKGDDLECDLPPKCEPLKPECGTNNCPCSKDACSGASQCGGDDGKKKCKLDPCQLDGAGRPSKSHPGQCVQVLEDDLDVSKRCAKTCNSDDDCGEATWCKGLDTLDNAKGLCTKSCSSGSGSDYDVGAGKLQDLLGRLLDGVSQLQGIDVTPHSYFDVKANFRTSLDVDWLPPGLTVSAVAEADFLTGLGLLFEFDLDKTWTLPADPPAETEFQLAEFSILGWPFAIKLRLHGYLKLETTAEGRLKLDYKIYSTRLAMPADCDPDSDDGCDSKLPWKDHPADWSTYKNDHAGGDYGGVPDSESDDDAVIGTYAQAAEDDKNYGIAYGASFGSDPNCLGYDKWCSKGDLLGIFGGALISKRVTTSLFGLDAETSIENYLSGEAGAQLGLYTNTGCVDEGGNPFCSRILFIEPINFLASAFAVFDPPYCGTGIDLFYRVLIGIGPIDLFGLLSISEKRLPLFKPISLLSTSWRASPSCYVPDGAEEPLDPKMVSNWDQDWADESFGCTIFRALAEIDPKLACGAPADTPDPSDSAGCPCGDSKSCFAKVCVPDPDGALRISMVGGSKVDSQGLHLSVITPSGDRLTPQPVETARTSSYQTLMTRVIESPESGVYKIRVVNEAGASLPTDNVQYVLQISGPDGDVQKIKGTVQREENKAPFVFRYRQ